MITVTNLNFYPIRISLKTFEILRSVLQFILAKPPEESLTKTFEFSKEPFFKATLLTKELEINHLLLKAILIIYAFFFKSIIFD